MMLCRDTERDLIDMAISMAESNRIDEATNIYHHLIASLEHVLGPEHPKVAWKKVVLSSFYEEVGEHEKAAHYLQQAAGVLDPQSMLHFFAPPGARESETSESETSAACS